VLSADQCPFVIGQAGPSLGEELEVSDSSRMGRLTRKFVRRETNPVSSTVRGG
jgi:hypothetical protein